MNAMQPLSPGLLLGLLVPALPALAQFDPPRTDLPPLAHRRAETLKKYDRDTNGRLSEAEREQMRKDWAAQMLSGAGRRRGGFPIPPELLQEFDKDRDGELGEKEEQQMRTTMQRRFEEVQKKYDADKSGELDPDELDKARADAEAGKLPGVPRFFFMRPGPRGGRGGRFFGARSENEFLLKFDRDGDGRMSAEELAAARAERDRLRAEAQRNVGKDIDNSPQPERKRP